MKKLLLFVISLIGTVSLLSEELTPDVRKENGRNIVYLAGSENPIILGHEVTVERIARSKDGTEFVLELWIEESFGLYSYGALVCEWNDSEKEWRATYQLMAHELTLKAGTRTGLAFVYDGFDSLDEVTVAISSAERRELPAKEIYKKEVWNLRTGESLRVIEEDGVVRDILKHKE